MALEHEDTAQLLLVPEYEISDDMNARRSCGFTLNTEVDAGATTRTSPRCDLNQFELWQKIHCNRIAMFEHPSNETSFLDS